jgi:hypothetical protein
MVMAELEQLPQAPSSSNITVFPSIFSKRTFPLIIISTITTGVSDTEWVKC